MRVTRADVGKECIVDNTNQGHTRGYAYRGKALITEAYRDAGEPMVKILTSAPGSRNHRVMQLDQHYVVSIGKKIY